MAVKKRDAAKGLGVINKTSKHGNEVVCRKGRYFVFLLICVSQREGCECASSFERFSGCSCTSVCYFTYFPTVVLLIAAHSRNIHFRSAWVFFKGFHFLHSQNWNVVFSSIFEVKLVKNELSKVQNAACVPLAISKYDRAFSDLIPVKHNKGDGSPSPAVLC